jgi:site-specific DNA-methyltransferase (adenine-specific)
MRDLLNKVMQGDCLEIMQEIPDKSVDMILCDLPYGTTVCKWDTIISFDELWAQYERVIKDDGAIILSASQPFTSALVMSNPKLFRYEWIWQKTLFANFMHLKRQPAKKHENT